MIDVHQLKQDFPIFRHHPKLVYLDSTASSMKPQTVIDAERRFYETTYANVHRGVYALSQQATELYEQTREVVRAFINARSTKEIIYVRNTTEALNLVAHSVGLTLKEGDVVLLSDMEHHSNIVPWQKLRDERGVELRWIPVTDTGDLDLTNLDDLLQGVKIVSVTHMSNVVAVVNDVKTIIAKAHAVGAKVVIDGAQSVPHLPVDVQDLDADFLAFSGHKMLGPMGIGVLYGKQEILEELPPFMRGGDMIISVTKDGASWNELPWKFEAGTPNAAGAIGLAAAIQYLQQIDMTEVWHHEQALARYGHRELKQIPGLRLLGDGAQSAQGAIFAFDLAGVHPHDIGSILDERGVAVRAGHHCAQPLHSRFGLVATTRASGYVYTSKEDIDALVAAILEVKKTFS